MKSIVVTVLLLTGVATASFAQGCSICTQIAAGMGSKKAKGLNGGIIYLGVIPLAILGTLGYAFWKSNKQTTFFERFKK